MGPPINIPPHRPLLDHHHDRKAMAEDFIERVSGTNGLAGAAETVGLRARNRSVRTIETYTDTAEQLAAFAREHGHSVLDPGADRDGHARM